MFLRGNYHPYYGEMSFIKSFEIAPEECCQFLFLFEFFQVIKLWDFETGTPIFEYGEAHGDSAITCMTFDNCGRR